MPGRRLERAREQQYIWPAAAAAIASALRTAAIAATLAAIAAAIVAAARAAAVDARRRVVAVLLGGALVLLVAAVAVVALRRLTRVESAKRGGKKRRKGKGGVPSKEDERTEEDGRRREGSLQLRQRVVVVATTYARAAAGCSPHLFGADGQTWYGPPRRYSDDLRSACSKSNHEGVRDSPRSVARVAGGAWGGPHDPDDEGCAFKWSALGCTPSKECKLKFQLRLHLRPVRQTPSKGGETREPEPAAAEGARRRGSRRR